MTGDPIVHYGLPPLLRSRWFAAVLILAWFLVISKAAYQASFSDDDLFNINLMQTMNAREWSEYLLSPRLSPDNIRPLGLLYYAALGRAAGLHYGPYVLVLQLLHLTTTVLLWCWLRPLGRWAATAGIVFFVGHAATLTTYWKPMYVFDTLCGLLTVAALLTYQHGRWILSLCCFWLAYKAKEAAIALPVVLTLHELVYSSRVASPWRRWIRLAPFWLISLSFGLQALAQPRRPNHDYDLHLSAAVVLACAIFYAGKVLFVPFGGFVLTALPALVRSCSVLLGIAAFWVLLAPMLVFPGRLQSAYLYVPLLGLALAVADVTAAHPRAIAALLLLWLPLDYAQIRLARQPVLALGHEHRPYIAQVQQHFALTQPSPRAVVYDGVPTTLGNWGVESLFRLAAQNPGLPVYTADSAAGRKALQQPDVPLLHWNSQRHQLSVEKHGLQTPLLSFIDFAYQDPIWQLDQNWYGVSGDCRWTRPLAALMLAAPTGPLTFTLRANIARGQSGVLRMRADGTDLLTATLDQPGWRTFDRHLQLPVSTGHRVEIQVDPPYRPVPGGEPLGLLVCAIGFAPLPAK